MKNIKELLTPRAENKHDKRQQVHADYEQSEVQPSTNKSGSKKPVKIEQHHLEGSTQGSQLSKS
jgi:hypothetical protein